MSEQGERPAAKRRTFLKLLGLGGATGAAALASGGTATGDSSEPKQHETGYRESAHVRKFYETAKF